MSMCVQLFGGPADGDSLFIEHRVTLAAGEICGRDFFLPVPWITGTVSGGAPEAVFIPAGGERAVIECSYLEQTAPEPIPVVGVVGNPGAQAAMHHYQITAPGRAAYRGIREVVMA